MTAPSPSSAPDGAPQSGPAVVALGGGHGTAVTLRAARRYAGLVTAVVSVADDGGSSGRLREILNVVALGDLRKCLVALAAEDSALARAFEHRFDEGELAGHALGNLILAGLVEATGDLVTGVRAAADLLIDTGELNTNQLRSRVLDAFGDEGGATSMRTSVVSFGYKYGLPLDVDLVFDCRFLPNPFWIAELRPFSGLDAPVRDYVLSQPETKDFLDKVDGLLTGILPAFVREGKSYLTIALGCTGGRHRSVALAEALGERIGEHGHPVAVFHRDVER